jgi:hypothetical protein
MSRLHRVAMICAAGVLVLSLPLACAGGHRRSAHRQLVDGCLQLGPDTEPLGVPVSDSVAARGVLIGRGRAGVVLANQSDRNLCSWLPFARRLSRAGFRVLLFDYSTAEPQVDVIAAAKELQRRGAR